MSRFPKLLCVNAAIANMLPGRTAATRDTGLRRSYNSERPLAE